MNKSNGKIVPKVVLSALVVLTLAVVAFASPKLVYAATHRDATSTETPTVVSGNDPTETETSTKEVSTETVEPQETTDQDEMNESQDVSGQDEMNEVQGKTDDPQEMSSQTPDSTQSGEDVNSQIKVETPEVETPDAVSTPMP